MLVGARSDEHESRLRPSPGARPPRRGQWTAGARRSPIVFVTAVKVPNDRMRGSQFSSWNISLPHRRYGYASFLCIALAAPIPDKQGSPECGSVPKKGHLWGHLFLSRWPAINRLPSWIGIWLEPYRRASHLSTVERAPKNPFSEPFVVAQSAPDTKPKIPCVCINEAWADAAVASVAVN